MVLVMVLAGCGRVGFEPMADASTVQCDDGASTAGTPCTLTFGDGPGATQPLTIRETWIAADLPGPFGDGGHVHTDGAPVHTGLWRFELTAIPPGAVVSAATLSAWVAVGPGEELGAGEILASPLLEPFDEDAATFMERSPGVPWTGPGATGASIDAGTIVFRAVAGQVLGMQGTMSVLVLDPAIVQGWVDRPADNLGIASRSTSGDGCGIVSSQSVDPTRRPALAITFTLP